MTLKLKTYLRLFIFCFAGSITNVNAFLGWPTQSINRAPISNAQLVSKHILKGGKIAIANSLFVAFSCVWTAKLFDFMDKGIICLAPTDKLRSRESNLLEQKSDLLHLGIVGALAGMGMGIAIPSITILNKSGELQRFGLKQMLLNKLSVISYSSLFYLLGSSMLVIQGTEEQALYTISQFMRFFCYCFVQFP